MKALAGTFNQEKALVPRRGLLRDCTTSPINRLQHLLNWRFITAELRHRGKRNQRVNLVKHRPAQLTADWAGDHY